MSSSQLVTSNSCKRFKSKSSYIHEDRPFDITHKRIPSNNKDKIFAKKAPEIVSQL